MPTGQYRVHRCCRLDLYDPDLTKNYDRLPVCKKLKNYLKNGSRKNHFLLDLPRLSSRTAKLYEKPPGPQEITSSSSKHEIVHSRYGMLFSVAGGGEG